MSVEEVDVNLERVKVIADLFCELGLDKIVKFDMLEPEYQALKAIRERGVKPEFLGLISICTGIIDFQLGHGGADNFWATLARVASGFDNLNNLKQVEFLIKVFLNEPINVRSLRIKVARIWKIFNSGFGKWFVENYERIRENPVLLWKRLSETIESRMERKTMVFAMKAFDISHVICFGDYAKFPWDIPIPVDFHVKNVTVSAGLLEHYGSDESFRKAWILVLKSLKERVGGNISLLRLDSLVWQIGKIMYVCGYDRNSSAERIQRYMMEKIGVDAKLATRFASELTRFIEKVIVTSAYGLSIRRRTALYGLRDPGGVCEAR